MFSLTASCDSLTSKRLSYPFDSAPSPKKVVCPSLVIHRVKLASPRPRNRMDTPLSQASAGLCEGRSLGENICCFYRSDEHHRGPASRHEKSPKADTIRIILESRPLQHSDTVESGSTSSYVQACHQCFRNPHPAAPTGVHEVSRSHQLADSIATQASVPGFPRWPGMRSTKRSGDRAVFSISSSAICHVKCQCWNRPSLCIKMPKSVLPRCLPREIANWHSSKPHGMLWWKSEVDLRELVPS